MGRLIVCCLALLLGVAPSASAAEPALRPLTVNGFVSASNLPLWAGQEQGFFRAEGIDLTLISPSGSIDQMRSLTEGRAPILLTAFDNVVAYQRGQGAPEIGAVADFVAVAGIDNGMLTLVTAPDIGTVRDLAGRTLAVDAPATGFTFALKAVLAQGGLDPAGNTLLAVGSTAGRWKALQDGRASGAVLTIPADVVAAESGFRALTTVDQALGPYLGNVVAARRGWIEAHGPLMADFLRAWRRSLAWTLAPQNRTAALALLRRQMPELTPDLAERVYGRLVDPRRGLFRTMGLDPAAVGAVLALRARFGPPSTGGTDPLAYIDPTFLKPAD